MIKREKKRRLHLGINGFGRTGRAAARIVLENNKVQLTAINSRAAADSHAYLLEYDSVHGRFPHKITVKDSVLVVNKEKIHCFQKEKPEDIPWHKASVDIVIEATGRMKKRDEAAGHLKSGVKKVIIAYPSPDADKTIVLGVNESSYNPKKDQVISNASCTTNCLAILCKVLDDKFDIERGVATTCHAPTMSQRFLDGSCGKDKRLGRAGLLNIIPTSTGAAKALGQVIPKLSGKLDSVALRVPVGDVSIIDLVVEIEKKASKEQVIDAFKKAAQGKDLKGILELAENELVSQDLIGRSASAIFDSDFTKVVGGNLVKVFGWYDNEWGYSNRLIDLSVYLFEKGL